MKRVLILGAGSAIAQAAARSFAARGSALFLVGRNAEKLETLAAGLRARGDVSVGTRVSDLNEVPVHSEIIREAAAFLGGLDTALIAYGVLGDDAKARVDFGHAREILETNLLSQVSLLILLAGELERRGEGGTLAVISSVAGDRGQRANSVYAASKAAISTFLCGLRLRLAPVGVNVLTVKPGWVDTPMIRHLPRNILWATPERVGEGIVRAISRRKSVVYLPWFWFWIMLVVRIVPESLLRWLAAGSSTGAKEDRN